MTDKLEALSQPVVWTNQQSDEAIKRLMTGLCMQENIMLYQALKQLENEIVQSAWAAMENSNQRIAMKKLEALEAVERVHVITPEIFGDVVRADDYDALLAALEEKGQRIAELNVKLFDQSILLDAAISRAEASGRREEHLKATVDVLSAKNAELQQRLQQPIKLRKCDIGIACEFISEHVVVSLAAVMVEAATAGFKVEVEGE